MSAPFCSKATQKVLSFPSMRIFTSVGNNLPVYKYKKMCKHKKGALYHQDYVYSFLLLLGALDGSGKGAKKGLGLR